MYALVSQEFYRSLMLCGKPNLKMLYDAAWRSGFAVNNWPADGPVRSFK